MFVLDTNVLSELLHPTPSIAVLRWLGAQQRSLLFITAITQAELLEGVARLPKGRRQAALGQAVNAVLETDFLGQILPFEGAAAQRYAQIAAARRRSGRPVAVFDTMIAAISLSQGMSLVTRNLRDFADSGVTLIDPWNA